MFTTVERHRRMPYLKNLVGQVAPQALPDLRAIGEIRQSVPVNIDRLAFEADHIVPINRIKEHNGFEAEIQSGLMKIMVIGLGKIEGAKRYHQAMISYGYHTVIMEGARTVLEKSKILFGVGSIENADDHGK